MAGNDGRTIKMPIHQIRRVVFSFPKRFFPRYGRIYDHAHAHIIIIWIKIKWRPSRICRRWCVVSEEKKKKKAKKKIGYAICAHHKWRSISFPFCAWKILWFFLALPICHKKEWIHEPGHTCCRWYSTYRHTHIRYALHVRCELTNELTSFCCLRHLFAVTNFDEIQYYSFSSFFFLGTNVDFASVFHLLAKQFIYAEIRRNACRKYAPDQKLIHTDENIVWHGQKEWSRQGAEKRCCIACCLRDTSHFKPIYVHIWYGVGGGGGGFSLSSCAPLFLYVQRNMLYK